jgi:ATP synthase protein I
MTNDDNSQMSTASKADSRLDKLEEELATVRRVEEERNRTSQKKPEKGYSQGNRVLAELLAGLAGGSLIGWLFDRWFGTSPWLLLVMLFLGIVVAFRNIIRISSERPE